MQKAVFFDRDGTLNAKSSGYVWRWDQFRWQVGAISAIKAANLAQYIVIVITNQAGVAHGRYTERDVELLHTRMNEDLHRHTAHIDGFYFCPHHVTGRIPRYSQQCHCRKPAPGLFESAIDTFDIDPVQSIMIGDQATDIQAAAAVGVNGVLLRYEEDIGSVLKFWLREQLQQVQ